MFRREASLIAGAVLALAGLAAAPAAAQEEVRAVISYYSDATGPHFEKVAKDFEAEHPDIDVQIEVVPWANLLQKLTTDIAANRAPDISIIGTRWLVDFVAQGIVEPLNEYITEDFRETFIPVFFEPSEIDGKIYGLPVAASIRAMYYNKDLFERAGLDPENPPQTWEEVRAAAEAISALGEEVYGFGLQGTGNETDAYFYYAMWTHGGEIFENGQSGLTSDAALQAAELYKGFIDDGLTQPGVTAYMRDDIQNLFKAGRIGMMITAPFLSKQIQEEAPELNYGITTIPEATARASYGVTDSIIMFQMSESKEAAWEFMKFAFQQPYRSEFTAGEGFLPVLEAVAEEPQFADNPDLKAFVAMLPFAKFAPTMPLWPEVEEATTRALQTIYLGDAEPQEALDQAAEEVNAILERAN